MDLKNLNLVELNAQEVKEIEGVYCDLCMLGNHGWLLRYSIRIQTSNER